MEARAVGVGERSLRCYREDQAEISTSLGLAHEVLSAVLGDAKASLWTLGRLALGLVMLGAQAGTRQPRDTLRTALRLSYESLPADEPDTGATVGWDADEAALDRLASLLISVDLSRMAYDLLGPLYVGGLPRQKRKGGGVYYTPPELVDLVLDTAAADAIAVRGDGRILDPAAGTGAFLVRLVSRARETAGAAAVRELLPRIAAIEASPFACALLRLNLALQWSIASPGSVGLGPPPAIAQGDALMTYSDFPPDAEVRTERGLGDHMESIARDAGFSLVLGNPPYMGESGHRQLFAPYRRHPFWRRFTEGKMDYLQYFIVLALSKTQLCPSGRIAFLTSAYWLTADGAQLLRDFVLTQAIVRDVRLLSDRRFEDAPGHDSAIILLERSSPESLEVAHTDQVRVAVGRPWFTTGSSTDHELLESLESFAPLNTAFEARQGLVPGAQRIGRTELAALGESWVAKHGIKEGEGVFVLTDAELTALSLPSAEQRFIRPFAKNSHIKRYAIDRSRPLWLIYLPHHEVREADCPRLIEHLARFKPLLTRKREYGTGRRAWFHLHWPREERLFSEEKIMTAHRGASPAFVWVPTPLFGATDVYFVRRRDRGVESAISLCVLLGLLNSAVGRFWFAHRTKAKAHMREFFSSALGRFPLPSVDNPVARGWLAEVECCARDLQHEYGSDTDVRREEQIEQRVDELAFLLYDLMGHAVDHIRNWESLGSK